MSYPELETLIDGLNKNAERERAEIEVISKGKVHEKSMQDLLDRAMSGNGQF